MDFRTLNAFKLVN